VVVSRPMPSPADVEVMAETIFGQHVARLPPGTWYPKKPIGQLMADGQGRRALVSRHPDPLAEAVRFAICEGELLQAVGRGRGVQRTAETPLEVLLLTNVPIPIPIDRLTTYKELVDGTGPLHELFAKGWRPAPPRR
jgi:putative DNA primase/helicase